MKTFVLIFSLVFISIKSQYSYDSELIKNIEEISTWSEIFGGVEMKHSCSIVLNPNTKKITILDYHDMYKKMMINEVSFYLDDIDKMSFKYNILPLNNDLYSVWVEISSNNKSISIKNTDWEKGKDYLAVTKQSVTNKTVFGANMNNISLYEARKYIDSWFKLTNSKKSTEIKY